MSKPLWMAKAEGKPNKYKAKRTEYGGRTYASRAEAKRAGELDILKAAGKVKWWLPQVPVFVGEDDVDNRVWIDFLVCEILSDGREHTYGEDVKGVETDKFKRQRKQWAKRGPFPLVVIKGKRTETLPPGTETGATS